jgi:hypothetical protein
MAIKPTNTKSKAAARGADIAPHVKPVRAPLLPPVASPADAAPASAPAAVPGVAEERPVPPRPPRGGAQEPAAAAVPSGTSASVAGTEAVPFTQRIPGDVKGEWDARMEGLGAPRGVALVVALRQALALSDDELEAAIAAESYRQQKARAARRAAARKG